jgi:hypothetical protein
MNSQQKENRQPQLQLENHEERLKVLERRIPNYPTFSVPDYTDELKMVGRKIDTFLNSNHQKNIDNSAKEIKAIVSRIPHVMHIQHHHHFAKLTARVVTAFLILILILAGVSWLAYYFYKH